MTQELSKDPEQLAAMDELDVEFVKAFYPHAYSDDRYGIVLRRDLVVQCQVKRENIRWEVAAAAVCKRYVQDAFPDADCIAMRNGQYAIWAWTDAGAKPLSPRCNSESDAWEFVAFQLLHAR